MVVGFWYSRLLIFIIFFSFFSLLFISLFQVLWALNLEILAGLVLQSQLVSHTRFLNFIIFVFLLERGCLLEGVGEQLYRQGSLHHDRACSVWITLGAQVRYLCWSVTSVPDALLIDFCFLVFFNLCTFFGILKKGHFCTFFPLSFLYSFCPFSRFDCSAMPCRKYLMFQMAVFLYYALFAFFSLLCENFCQIVKK